MMRIIAVGSAIVSAILAASPLLAAEAPKRRVDQWSGIVFFCNPDINQGWTVRSCKAITETLVERTEAIGVKVAILEASSAPQWMSKSAEVGFDGGYALSVVFEFEPSKKPVGYTGLNLIGQFPVDPKPGIEPKSFTYFITHSTTFDPGEHSGEAEEVAAALWSGVLEYLAGPMAP